MNSYPDTPSARDRFVVERRGLREAHDPWRHQGVMVEDERAGDGSIARVATVFLTGRECPWRCVMCDLWRYTIEADTPVGAIPAQVAAAMRDAGDATVMKLYNAGSFFDPRAVPEVDYDDIASQLVGQGLERVIVESHPALIGARVDRFVAALGGSEVAAPRLEVAMGLETAHPVALERLHKRVTLEQFARAAAELRRRDVALRVFLLISPPFVPADEQDAWLLRSIDFAFECGASVVSLVPTRSGNGAMEALGDAGEFRAPTIGDIERSFAAALVRVRAWHASAQAAAPAFVSAHVPASAASASAPVLALDHVLDHARYNRRVFVDLWELQRFADADPGEADFAARRERLALMNIDQRVLPEIARVPVGVADARHEVAS